MDIRWSSAWSIEVGVELRRHEIHETYGGQQQGGISSAPQAGSVFLFTGSTGQRYGYNYDGWQPDGSFHYTGEGRIGDQQLVRGNKTTLRTDRTIRVFKEVRRSVVAYLGEFRLDEEQPYYRADAPAEDGEMRSVLVFRLWPVNGGPSTRPTETKPGGSRTVPLETHLTETFIANPASGQTNCERREAALVGRYGDWLTKRGHSAVRNEIFLPGQTRALYTDVYDETAGELIEAKGSATRENVRLALGQVLDYARYVEHQGLGVLLPVRPADDLVQLLSNHGIDCIYETHAGQFDRA